VGTLRGAVTKAQPRNQALPAIWRGCFLVVILSQACHGNSFAIERFHDPSAIIQCKDEYWIFSTGAGVKSWRSKDRLHWEAGPRVLEKLPPWINDIVPGHKGYFWAPDPILSKGRYLLYYSVSGWGKNASAIGLATNSTLDPADPAYRWTDEGIVVQSTLRDSYNAIDPSLTFDAEGRLWMAFGSFWAGIQLVELDPVSGKRIKPDSPLYPLAFHKTIEAPCIIFHGGAYYLFVNWGFCCRGMNSTYEIRVGRSNRITGPYVDQKGEDLRVDGGSLFLGNEGTLIGPGHAGVFQEGKNEWLSYHFYDATDGGAATLGIRRLEWDAAGWPKAGERVMP
jgi:arabinan endo-1,5-alpha-L-arabinosidase